MTAAMVFIPPLLVGATLLKGRARYLAIGAVLVVAGMVAPEPAFRMAAPLAIAAIAVQLLPAGWAPENRRSIQVSIVWATLGVIALYPMSLFKSWAGSLNPPRLASLFDVSEFGAGMLLIGLLAALFADFNSYWLHRLKHRVPWMWRFHEIHHSAPELGLFAQRRLHPVDTLIGQLWQPVPILLIGPKYFLPFPPYGIFRTAMAYYQHANTRLESRWLSRVFVTPSVHRIWV